LWVACQPKATDTPLSGIEQLYKDYEMQPTNQSASIFLDSLSSHLSKAYENEKAPIEYLERGAMVSAAQGMQNVTPGYLLPLIKDYPNHPKRVEYQLQLGDIMDELGITHASSIIYNELLKQHPDNAQVQERKTRIDPKLGQEEDYMVYLFDQMTQDTDESGINRAAALRYVDAAEAKALMAPDDPSTPNHLYGAAEVARSLRTFAKAMSLYDWILEKYPDNEKAPNVLFIKGFILEQDYNREDDARVIYEKFLAQYPDHVMAESAKFLLNNLGKTDD